MKLSTRLYLLSVLAVAGVSAQAACVYPQAPQSLPNGATATKEQMLAGQAAVKEYQKGVEGTYLPCLDQEKAAAIAALDTTDAEYAQKKQAIEVLHGKKNNAAIDELQAVASRWNEEIKAYQTAQKK